MHTMYLTPDEAAHELHTERHVIYELGRRENDRLPLGHPPWNDRKWLIAYGDLEEWAARNIK